MLLCTTTITHYRNRKKESVNKLSVKVLIENTIEPAEMVVCLSFVGCNLFFGSRRLVKLFNEKMREIK